MFYARAGAADEPASGAPECSGTVNRTNVARCVLAASPALREEVASRSAALGRLEAARPFLPSNPALSGGAVGRFSPTNRTANWNAVLSQELEIVGQSGLRVEAAEKQLQAQEQRLLASRSDVAARGWAAYFIVLAAKERLKLASRLEAATGAVASTARAMAASGVVSEVEGDVAEAAALRASQERLGLEAVLAAATVRLQQLIGGDAAPEVDGLLEPIRGVGGRTNAATRPELLALQEEQTALLRRAELLRRQRVPNPTVSLLAQSDGFDEYVFGASLSIPIPLPQPVGRTMAGEIAEATALAEKTSAERDRLRRDLEAERAIAVADFEAASKSRALYSPELIQRATLRLDSIATQLKAARLPVRDALIAQQALVDQLRAEIEAREALCLASVRLARASGLSLEGDAL